MNAIDTVIGQYVDTHPGDAAQLAERLDSAQLADIAESLAPSMYLSMLDYLSPARAIGLFALMPVEAQASIVSEATPRTSTLLLSGLESEDREALLEGLPETDRAELQRILSYPEDTAARLMDGARDTLQPTMTVADARSRLRASGLHRARSLYAVDTTGRLVGRVDVQDLATEPADTPLSRLLHAVDGTVAMTASRAEIVELFHELGLDSIPVVDGDLRLVGVVRYASLSKAIENVASANMQKMVGMSVDERALSSPTFAVKRRLGWLHINLLTAFLAASVVGLFEELIAQVTALAILLPVVAGQSGNAGSQALAVTMRGLVLREVGTNQWHRVMSKEALVGLINGIALAVTCGLGVYLWSGSLGIAGVIGIAMVLSMIAAGVAGAAVPMILIRLRQDPATASSIILTTVTDVSGFLAFLGTASLMVALL